MPTPTGAPAGHRARSPLRWVGGLLLGLVAWFVWITLRSSNLGASEATSEGQAIAALQDLVTQQAVFREADKEGDGNLDYGTLAELGAASLIPADLAAGRAGGYLFEVHVPDATGQRWIARAAPRIPNTSGYSLLQLTVPGLGPTGERVFLVDATGVVRYASRYGPRADAVDAPIPADGVAPADWPEVGR